MATPVMMPRQGQSVESCIMGQWHKSVGEKVKKGDLLFSYETDKATFDEEAAEDGILLVIFFEEGDEVPVLTNVAVIGKAGEPVDEFAPGGTVAASAAGSPEPEVKEETEEAPTVIEFDIEENDTGKRIRISPLAKNMALKAGLDISRIKGSGPRGRIIARDIETAGKSVQQPVAAPAPSAKPETQKAQIIQTGDDFEIKPISNIRKLIAHAMHQSLQNSAQLTHHLSADARQLLKLRKKYKKALAEGTVSQNVTINDLVCFATIRALEKFPQVNTHYLGDKMKWFKKVHLGLAVDTERGLMVPALQNADDLSLTGLSFQLQQLAAQARSGSVNPDLLNPEAASFTISNLGNYGVEMLTPVNNLQQTAILGVCTNIPRRKDIEEGINAFVPVIGL